MSCSLRLDVKPSSGHSMMNSCPRSFQKLSRLKSITELSEPEPQLMLRTSFCVVGCDRSVAAYPRWSHNDVDSGSCSLRALMIGESESGVVALRT